MRLCKKRWASAERLSEDRCVREATTTRYVTGPDGTKLKAEVCEKHTLARIPLIHWEKA